MRSIAGWPFPEGRRRTSFANAEEFERMGKIHVSVFLKKLFDALHDAVVEILYASTFSADHVVVVVSAFAAVLEADRPIAEVDSADKPYWLKGGENPVNRDQVATLLLDASMDLVEGERTMFPNQEGKDRETWAAGFKAYALQTVRGLVQDRGIELFLRILPCVRVSQNSPVLSLAR